MIHVVGTPAVVPPGLIRQRCAWCGALILDYDLGPMGQDPMPAVPAMWEVGALVAIDDGVSHVVPRGDELPAGACALLEATT